MATTGLSLVDLSQTADGANATKRDGVQKVERKAGGGESKEISSAFPVKRKTKRRDSTE